MNFIKSSENDDFDNMQKNYDASPLKSMTINFTNSTNGKTALHYAVQFDNKKIVEFLIKQGIDKDKKDVNNDTAYDLAKKLGKNGLFDYF